MTDELVILQIMDLCIFRHIGLLLWSVRDGFSILGLLGSKNLVAPLTTGKLWPSSIHFSRLILFLVFVLCVCIC